MHACWSSGYNSKVEWGEGNWRERERGALGGRLCVSLKLIYRTFGPIN